MVEDRAVMHADRQCTTGTWAIGRTRTHAFEGKEYTTTSRAVGGSVREPLTGWPLPRFTARNKREHEARLITKSIGSSANHSSAEPGPRLLPIPRSFRPFLSQVFVGFPSPVSCAPSIRHPRYRETGLKTSRSVSNGRKSDF